MNNWNVIEIEPTPARGKFVNKLLDDPNYAAEKKEDGDRRTGQIYWEQREHGFQVPLMHFAGRRVSVETGKMAEKSQNVPHITRCQSVANWGYDSALMERQIRLAGTVFDGECVLPAEFVRPLNDPRGGLSKYVTRVMGCGTWEKARERQEQSVEDGGVGGKMRYSVFDLLFYHGRDLRDLPLCERRKWLLEAVTCLGNPYITATEHVVEDKRAFLERTLDAGDEGIILKKLDAPYGQHLTWVKQKVKINADVVIIGFDPPEQFSKKVTGEISETKFWKKGWISAVQFGQYRDGIMWPCGTMSGMTDKFRAELTENQEKYLGRVVEVEANGREPTGAFRHPRWERLRDSKTAAQCVYDPDET